MPDCSTRTSSALQRHEWLSEGLQGFSNLMISDGFDDIWYLISPHLTVSPLKRRLSLGFKSMFWSTELSSTSRDQAVKHSLLNVDPRPKNINDYMILLIYKWNYIDICIIYRIYIYNSQYIIILYILTVNLGTRTDICSYPLRVYP